jgi:hypothetical protein
MICVPHVSTRFQMFPPFRTSELPRPETISLEMAGCTCPTTANATTSPSQVASGNCGNTFRIEFGLSMCIKMLAGANFDWYGSMLGRQTCWHSRLVWAKMALSMLKSSKNTVKHVDIAWLVGRMKA